MEEEEAAEEEEVVVVEDVHGVDLMTAGDARPQGADQGLEVVAQDSDGVHEIAQNMGLALNPALIPQTEQKEQTELMEMAAQHLVLDPGQGSSQGLESPGLGSPGLGLGPRIEMEILMKNNENT